MPVALYEKPIRSLEGGNGAPAGGAFGHAVHSGGGEGT